MTVKVMVSFPDEFLFNEVDRIESEEQRSRSELVQEAIRLYIEMRRQARKPGDIPHVRQAAITQDALSRLASGTGEDSTAELRRWREAHS